MKLLDAYGQLLTLKQEVLQTNDIAACLQVSILHASQISRRLAKAGLFVPLSRGKWACHSNIDPLVLPEYLTSPAPSYVSFQSALYYHGMISQIPHVIYAASLRKTREYKTPVATVSIHHIDPNFFFGFEVNPRANIKMAMPEKALLDVLYLSNTRSHLFSALPELELPKTFNVKKALKMIDSIQSAQKRTMVFGKFQKIITDS